MYLGQKVNRGMEISVEEEKEVFPSLYIHSDEELKFPDGKFKFCGEGKICYKEEKDRDGKKSYCYEIDVYDLTPTGKVKEDRDEMGESMEDAFDRAFRDKMKSKKIKIIEEDEEDYED